MTKNNDIKILLGKRIKELRIKKGLTQERLAEMVGIGERNLSKIECGTNFVTSETLSKMLIALDVEAQELFDYGHHKEKEALKNELINALNDDTVDVELLYRIYRALQ
ncbi:MAG: helix-turn-helix transcriptional regulator [Candidatus Gastranaerophilales bacterium]|nr:helix-turn-helix transcriptional regulator [Candidatus Gastranaerophilales bacterium]